MTSDLWPFEDPKNVAVFTSRSIAERGNPILLVVHDEDDGSWQFLDGGEFRMEDAMIVALSEIVDIDESIRQLADLPEGWGASRTIGSEPWNRFRIGAS